MARSSLAESGSRLRIVPPTEPKPTRQARGPLGVVDQVVVASRRHNRLATVLGAILGGVVPFLTFMLAHYGIDRTAAVWTQASAWIVLGGLAYSASTVYGWGKLAFGSAFKAAGFVLLTEGAMVLTPEKLAWLAYIPLVLLVAVNGVATACRLVLDRKKAP